MTSKLAWGILGTGNIARTLAAAITRFEDRIAGGGGQPQ